MLFLTLFPSLPTDHIGRELCRDDIEYLFNRHMGVIGIDGEKLQRPQVIHIVMELN